jgi:hypothetical protein
MTIFEYDHFIWVSIRVPLSKSKDTQAIENAGELETK